VASVGSVQRSISNEIENGDGDGKGETEHRAGKGSTKPGKRHYWELLVGVYAPERSTGIFDRNPLIPEVRRLEELNLDHGMRAKLWVESKRGLAV